MQAHGHMLLHLFCASRFYSIGQLGFRCLPEVELWVRGANNCKQLTTPLGAVPLWIVDGRVNGYDISKIDDRHQLHSLCRAQHHDHHLPPAEPRNHKQCASIVSMAQAAKSFLEQPLGKYTAFGANSSVSMWRKNLSTSTELVTSLEALNNLWSISDVAKRMLLTRRAWLYGEDALKCDCHLKAISWFVLSLRCCHADGDPFSGSFHVSQHGHIDSKYYLAVDDVLRNTANSPARLVRASAMIHEQKWVAAEVELTQCIAESPNEMAAFHLRAMVRGNLAKWEEARSDSQRGIELAPEEPIHRFWRAVTTRNLSCNSQALLEQVVADYEAFVSRASRGGRRVCDAYFELVVMQMHLASVRNDSKSDNEAQLPLLLDLCARGARFSYYYYILRSNTRP